jgi:hypothetical protein
MADRGVMSEAVAWVTDAGLAGSSEAGLLRGFCERASAAGLPIVRAVVIIDTLHPFTRGGSFAGVAIRRTKCPWLNMAAATSMGLRRPNGCRARFTISSRRANPRYGATSPRAILPIFR